MANHFEVLRTTEAEGGVSAEVATETRPANGNIRPQRLTAAYDEIAKLVQRVFVLPGSTKAPGAVAFCGVEAGAGCSWVCARSSEALAAQVTGTVCVVDANLRHPALHEYFGLAREEGFTQAMRDSRPVGDFAQRVGKTNLWVMPSGGPGREPNGTLNPARLRARFSELRAQFDYLLLDTPAIASFSDGVLLAQMVDGAILIVGSNSTRRESARAVKQSFDAAGVPVLGVVLNQRTYPIPEALYRRL